MKITKLLIGLMIFIALAFNALALVEIDSPNSAATYYVGLPITFQAHVADIENPFYIWEFEEGVYESGSEAEYIYSTPGEKTATIAVNSNDQTVAVDTITFNVVNRPGVSVFIDFPFENSVLFQNQQYTFTGRAIGFFFDDYFWKIDGNVISGTSTAYSFSELGIHTIQFTAMKNGEFMGGKQIEVNVISNSVNQAPVITSFSPINNPTITLGNSQLFTVNADDEDPLTYTWKLDNTEVGTNSNTYTYTSSSLGAFNVEVSVSDGISSVSKSWVLTVEEEEEDDGNEEPDSLYLSIEDLDIKVDSKTDTNVQDGETISREAVPGSTVTLKLKIKNTGELEINDVSIKATLESIDDGDDVEEENNEFDLKEGKSRSDSITLNIPYEVDEGTYDLKIHVEGEDEDNDLHEIDWSLNLAVEKEKHKIIIYKAELGSETLECVKTTNLNLEILNIGQEEEDAKIVVYNKVLGIDFIEDGITLSEDPFSDESGYNKIIKIKLSESFKEGIYPISIKVYRDDELEDEKELSLIVSKCAIEEVSETSSNNKIDITKVPVKIKEKTAEESNIGLIAAFSLGILLVVVLAFYLINFLVKKR